MNCLHYVNIADDLEEGKWKCSFGKYKLYKHQYFIIRI